MTVTDDAPTPDEAPGTVEGIGDPILDLLNGFIVQLRAAGLPVSLTENLDAMEAVKHVPLEDRQTFKYALAATLVKHHNHWKAFETVFEVYFSLRGDEYQIGDQKRTAELTIKKDGDKLVGTMSWPDQKETNLKDLKLKDGALTFSALRKIMDNEITVEYKLTIDGDKLKGKAATEFGGQKQEYDLNGKREKKDKHLALF